MDLNSLRGTVEWMADSRQIYTTPDGRIDVYRMIHESRALDERVVEILRSERAGVGPPDQEVRAGDYQNFLWERARVDEGRRQWILWTGEKGIDRNVTARPVLWEREPHHGEYLVAFTDGSVKNLPEDEFKPVK